MERSHLASIIILLVLALPLTINICFDEYNKFVEKVNREINEGLKHYYRFAYICQQIYRIPTRKIKLEDGAFATYITHWGCYSSSDVCSLLYEVDCVPFSDKQRAYILKAYGETLVRVFDVDKLAFIYEEAVSYEMNPKMRMGYATQNFILKLITERMSYRFANRVITLMCARLAKEHAGDDRYLLSGRICEFEIMFNIEPRSHEKMYKTSPYGW
jgi:hypothetical protein